VTISQACADSVCWQTVNKYVRVRVMNTWTDVSVSMVITLAWMREASGLKVRKIRGLSEKSIRPLWISREPVAWPWCNLAASQRTPYCTSVNSHSPVGLVIRQWDAVDWACVLCDSRIQNDRVSRFASSRQCTYPF